MLGALSDPYLVMELGTLVLCEFGLMYFRCFERHGAPFMFDRLMRVPSFVGKGTDFELLGN